MSTRVDEVFGVIGPPRLNTVPWGLLDFFGIKNGGRFPQTLTTQLVAQFDLADWYIQTKAEVFSGQAAAIAGNNGAATGFALTGFPGLTISAGDIVVPQDEWWIIRRANINAVMNAAFAGSFHFVVGIERLTQREQLFSLDGARAAAAVSTEVCAFIRDFLFVAPGATIRLQGDTLSTAGTVTPTLDFLIARMKT